jgi:peptidoglycan/LPS O-acetylase OafA/YrhL
MFVVGEGGSHLLDEMQEVDWSRVGVAVAEATSGWLARLAPSCDGTTKLGIKGVRLRRARPRDKKPHGLLQPSRRSRMSRPSARGILPGIQLLRGVAAAMVVLSHTNTMMSHPEFFSRSPFGFALTGEFGVAIFFVISGFIIAYVSLDAQLAPRLTKRDFAWRRAIRILPFMWLCVIGYNALSFVGTHRIEWAPMLRALVLWPIGELKPNVLWSLRHEWLFYLLFALALLSGRRRSWILAVWFAGPILAAIFLRVAPTAPAAVGAEWSELARMVFMGGQNGANFQFAAGYGLGLLQLCDHAIVRPRVAGGLYVVLLAVVLSTLLIENVRFSDDLVRALCWTACSTLTVWLALVTQAGTGWLTRAAIVLGNATFAIYLVHNPVLLVDFALALKLAPGVPTEVLYPAFVASAIAVGIAVHYLVEAPLIRILAKRGPGAGRSAPSQGQRRS